MFGGFMISIKDIYVKVNDETHTHTKGKGQAVLSELGDIDNKVRFVCI